MSDPLDDAPVVTTQHDIFVSSRAPLSADDAELHALMRHTIKGYMRQDTGKRALSGLRIPLGAIGLLMKNPALWPWAIAPALINVLVLVGTLVLTLPAASSWFSGVWAAPEIVAWYHYGTMALWGLCYVLIMLLTLVISYMGSMMIGGVVASPFNDVLSEKSEKILLGARYVTPPEVPFLPSVLKSMASSAAMAGMYFAVMAPMLLLHLVPVVGSIAYTLLGGVVGGYFVALEYSDTFLERQNTPFKKKLARVWEERSLTLGFGVGTSLMLAIPFVNFLCLPIAVIGGTALGTALLEAPRQKRGGGAD